MIKNQKQAAITKEKLQQLKKAKTDFENQEVDKKSSKYKLGIKGLNGLIDDLQNQLNEYDGLVHGNFHCLQSKPLNEIPNVLIAARLAQKLSQKQLAELLGLKEQQIQRYESTDYETASWIRIVEISIALGLKLKVEKTIIINGGEEIFQDVEFAPDLVELAEQNIKQNGLFILN